MKDIRVYESLSVTTRDYKRLLETMSQRDYKRLSGTIRVYQGLLKTMREFRGCLGVAHTNY